MEKEFAKMDRILNTLKFNHNQNQLIMTIAQQLGVTTFPFTITDNNGKIIYYENAIGYTITFSRDRHGNLIKSN